MTAQERYAIMHDDATRHWQEEEGKNPYRNLSRKAMASEELCASDWHDRWLPTLDRYERTPDFTPKTAPFYGKLIKACFEIKRSVKRHIAKSTPTLR